jgi:hypothetical protein
MAYGLENKLRVPQQQLHQRNFVRLGTSVGMAADARTTCEKDSEFLDQASGTMR